MTEVDTFEPHDEAGQDPPIDGVSVEIEHDEPRRKPAADFGDKQRKKYEPPPPRMQRLFDKLKEKDSQLEQERAARRDAEQRLQRLEATGSEFLERTHTAEVDRARYDLKKAVSDGDADAVADATERLSDAKVRVREAQRYKESVSNQPKPQQQQTPQIGECTQSWVKDNPWFNSDPEMTQTALIADRAAQAKGMAPDTDEYFAHIDSVVHKHHADAFQNANDDEPEPPPPPRRQQAIAPAQRQAASVPAQSPRMVKLTAEQAAVADSIGISREAYARQLVAKRGGR